MIIDNLKQIVDRMQLASVNNPSNPFFSIERSL